MKQAESEKKQMDTAIDREVLKQYERMALMSDQKIRVKILGGKAPKRRQDSAGYDCFARENGVINPFSQVKIPLGFASAFPEHLVALIFDKSGVGNQGIMRVAGVIDATYRDEWQFMAYNNGARPYNFVAGQAICQVLFVEYGVLNVVEVEDLETTTRVGGFGTTDFDDRLRKIGRWCEGNPTPQSVEWLATLEAGRDPGPVPDQIKLLDVVVAQQLNPVGKVIEEKVTIGAKPGVKGS